MSGTAAGAISYPMGDSDEERDRLVEQAQLIGHFTRRLLEDAGLRPGMRVLDVGSGVGDVSMLAAALVGPTGTVVGVDKDSRSLELATGRARVAGLANVTYVHADVETLQLHERFDAVVGRWILMYLGDPAAALGRFAGHLSGGGIVAFQEGWFDSMPALCLSEPGPVWNEGLGWAMETFRRAGRETEMGRRLYATFRGAGLPPPRMRMEVHFITAADRLGPALAAHSLRSIQPLAERVGVAAAREMDVERYADRLRAEIESRESVLAWTPLISAWTRTAGPAHGSDEPCREVFSR
jgi:SAM-dependent methyltransferase